MAAVGINVVLVEKEDQFISISSVAVGYGPQEWCFSAGISKRRRMPTEIPCEITSQSSEAVAAFGWSVFSMCELVVSERQDHRSHSSLPDGFGSQRV